MIKYQNVPSRVEIPDEYQNSPYLKSITFGPSSELRQGIMPANLVPDPETFEIAGMRFAVEREDRWVILTNEEWPSLTASGEGLNEARDQLYEVIGTASSVYLLSEVSELSADAIRFREYLRRSLAL
jgi:hypothetical protein